MDRQHRQRRVTLKALKRILESFGYSAQSVAGGRIIFTHPHRSLLILLPILLEDGTIRPIDLLSVRNTLINDGVIRDEEQFDSLFRIKRGDQLIWTEPRTKNETTVTAASGETSDGMVIIKQKGAFMPCHVSQLLRLEDLEEAAEG
jgi:hypothetical protein